MEVGDSPGTTLRQLRAMGLLDMFTVLHFRTFDTSLTVEFGRANCHI
jgi:hypothetical protein